MMSDEHEWEYYEMALQDLYLQEMEKKDRACRFAFLPTSCQKCRWLDWRCTEDCTQRAMFNVENYCCLFLRDIPPFKPKWLWRHVIDLQYLLWAIYNACMVGIAEVEPTLKRHYKTGG
jgi:hypothetical protein